MNCREKLIKLLLVLWNFLVLIGGISFILFGTVGTDWWGGKDAQKLLLNGLVFVKTTLLVFGITVSVVAFCGCCGAWKKSRCLLMLFTIFMVLIVVLQVSMILYYHFTHFNVKDVIDKMSKDNHTMELMKKFESDNQCCGFTGFHDYDNLKSKSPCVKEDYKSTGCLSKIKSALFKKNFNIILGVIAVIEILNIIFPIILMSALKKRKYYA